MGIRKLAAAAAAAVFSLSLAVPAWAGNESGGFELAPGPAAEAAAEAAEVPAAARAAEDAPAGTVVFEPSSVDLLIVSSFGQDETVVPMYLGGGAVLRELPDGSTDYVQDGVTYAWYESDEHGAVKGDVISTEEFLFNDGSLDYDPHKAGIHIYKEIVSVDGEEVGSQLFFLVVVESSLRFEINAPTDSVQQGPVTLTAAIPDDFDAQVAALKNLLPELADEEMELTRSMSYWGGAAQLDAQEGVSPQGLPALTVQPFGSSLGYADLRYVVEYELLLNGHLGAVRIYSNPFRLYANDATGGESSRLFEAAPLTETELRSLYDTLIAPFHDETKSDPFALKPAQTDATGALTAGSQNELFALVNFMRRCAGVDPLYNLDARKTNFAQAGARYMSETQQFGHAVAEGKDPDAHEGLMRSNLSNGWWSSGAPYDYITLQMNQFYDNSSAAMPRMEHRQLLLDNRLISTGFGYMGPTSENNRTYLVTHVDGSELRTTPATSLEAFPGVGAFPVELMNFKGWTLTLGNGWTIPNHSEIRVTVTREDGESWSLRQLEDPSTAYSAEGDWFCAADKGEVGSGACILFSPASIFQDGDYKNKESLKGHTYTIAIEGVVDNHGEDVSRIEYSTQFISLAEPASADPGPSSEPTQDPTPSTEPSQRPQPVPDLSELGIESIDGTDYITGVLAGTKAYTVAEYLEQAMAAINHAPDSTFRIVASLEDQAPLGDEKAVGSGQLLQVLRGNGSTLMSIPIVIAGDVTGSGKIDIAQLSTLAKHLTGTKKLEGAKLVAGDMNGNGKVDIADLSRMAERLVSAS